MTLSSWLTLCDDERRLALRPLCLAGLTDREIANRLGTSKGSISHFLSVKARDLQALRRERAADRLDGVVADARAAAVAPAAEPDRIAGLESSVAALTATVGEVLDVVRGIAARMEERAAEVSAFCKSGPDYAPTYADAPAEVVSPPRNRGGRKPVYTPAQIDTIRHLAAEGRTDGYIAEVIGAPHRDTVRGLRKRHGIRSAAAPAPRAPRPPPKRSFWTDERVEQMRALAGEGMTDREILDAMGLSISKAALKDARKRYGIKSGAKQTMPDRLAEIRRMASEGQTDNEIAAALGDRSHWSVAKLRQRHRIPAGKPLETVATLWTDDRIAEMRRLAGEGLGDAAIAETMGIEVTPSAIRQARKKHGIAAGARRGGGRVWSDEDVEAVRRLVAAGRSSRYIAGSFEGRYTRNAVIGLCHRLGLQLHGKPGGQRTEARVAARPPAPKVAKASPAPPRPGNVVPLRRAENAPRSLARSVPVARPTRPASQPALVKGAPVGLLDLAGKQCRFPVGESPDVIGRHLFCAANTGDLAESYCAHHRFRCASGAVYGRLRDAARMPGEGRAA